MTEKAKVWFACSARTADPTSPPHPERLVEFVAAEVAKGTFTRDGSDGWLRDDVPAFFRDGAWVLPLAWEPKEFVPETNDFRGRLFDEMHHLWSGVDSALTYRCGNPGSAEAAYAEKKQGYLGSLAAAGASRAYWWAIGSHAVVLVLARGAEAGSRLCSLHVVPCGWVSVNRPARSPIIDLGWTWDDVLRLAREPSR